jgi:hypothetical protein
MKDESAEAGAEAAPGPGAGPEAVEGTGALAEFLAAMRRRPALTIFLFGLVLFTGGLVSVIGNQIGSAAGSLPDAPEEGPAARQPGAGRVGPEFGEPIGPYVEKARSTLSERARSDPSVPTLALVVFKEYRTAGQVEAFLEARSMEALSAQVRVPVRSFKPQEVFLESKSLADASAGMRGALQRELETLQKISEQAKDPSYRAVYAKDAELYEEALGKLTTDPATIFAVVVRANHSTLATAARAGEVRFVDLPGEPTATLEDTTFAAVIPEDTETATFAVQ